MAFQLALSVSLAMVDLVSVSMVYDVIASMACLPKDCYVFASMASVSRADVVSV